MKLAGLVQTIPHPEWMMFHWRMFPKLFGRYRDILAHFRFASGSCAVVFYESDRTGTIRGLPITTVVSSNTADALRILGYDAKYQSKSKLSAAPLPLPSQGDAEVWREEFRGRVFSHN